LFVCLSCNFKVIKNTPLCTLLCVLFTLIPAVDGHPQADESYRIITELAIFGLKRTKPHIVEAVLEPFIGQSADTLDINAVHAAVLDTGILEPLTIEILDVESGDGKALAVTVREKWSIFPVPVFFVASETVSGGIFFADSNAFGLNDRFFLGGMYGVDGWMFMSGYMHSGRKGLPGWSLSCSFARTERKDKNQRDEELRCFAFDTGGASAGLSYNLTGTLGADLRVSYRQIMLRDGASSLHEPEAGARAFGVSAGLSARKSHWDGFLLSEESAGVNYGFTAGIEGFSFHELSLQLRYQKSLLPGFKAKLHTGLLYQPDVPVLFESSPYAAQVDILPSSFKARHYAGASFGLEKYIFKISAGTVSAMAAYQVVFSEGPVLGTCFDHGLAASIVFYLSRLAIPAMGLGLAYNVPAEHLQFSFSLGMSF
jgi:outer membrane protein assembly factor BamA